MSIQRELRRVLKPTGWAILQVPIKEDVPTTDEDPSITDPRVRRQRFGQHDHVRWYGADYRDRLREAGFAVEPIDYISRFSPEERARFGLVPELLNLCRPADH